MCCSLFFHITQSISHSNFPNVLLLLLLLTGFEVALTKYFYVLVSQIKFIVSFVHAIGRHHYGCCCCCSSDLAVHFHHLHLHKRRALPQSSDRLCDLDLHERHPGGHQHGPSTLSELISAIVSVGRLGRYLNQPELRTDNVCREALLHGKWVATVL